MGEGGGGISPGRRAGSHRKPQQPRWGPGKVSGGCLSCGYHWARPEVRDRVWVWGGGDARQMARTQRDRGSFGVSGVEGGVGTSSAGLGAE